MRRAAHATAGLLAALLLAAPLPTPAVVIAGGDGSGNADAPPDDPGWSNVGQIYLGRGWVLSAGHAARLTGFFSSDAPPLRVGLAGQGYPAVRGSGVTLKNPDGSPADLVLLRIEGRPALDALSIARASPALGAPVVLIGRGRQREADLSTWSAEFAPVPRERARRAGFRLSPSRFAKRWGENRVAATSLDVPVPGGHGRTRSFATRFEPNAGPSEAQATEGDSGGAVFSRDARDGWVLSGVMLAVSGVEGQPADAVVFGSGTLVADLSLYRDQILNHTGAPDEGLSAPRTD